MEYLVIQGAFLRPEYDRIWLDTLRKLQKRGVKIIVLSAGMMDYSAESVHRCRELLSEVPPFIFTTRDSETYHHFADIPEYSYDGIDTALFVSDFFQPPTVTMDEYVVFNFDKWPEPKIWPAQNTSQQQAAGQTFHFNEQTWHVQFPRTRTNLVKKSRLLQFIDSWIPENTQTDMGGIPIVRTDHRFNPLLIRRIFKRANTFVSDIPQSYLTLYANSSLTLSNRVHACIATLAYGNPAMLFSHTPRSKLLDRIGLHEITKEPQLLNQDYIREEKAKLLGFLQSVL